MFLATTVCNVHYKLARDPGAEIASLPPTPRSGARPEPQSLCVTSLRFAVEGLDEWHAVSGFQLTHEAEFKKINLSYEAPPEIPLWSDGEFSLDLCFSWTVPNVHEKSSATISQGSRFRLKSTAPRPAGDFIKLASRIVMFLAFALDKIVAIREVVGRSPEFAHDFSFGRQEVDIAIYFQSLLFSAKKRDFRYPDSIITFERVLSAPQSFFDAWFRICDKATPALRLFFEARSDSKQYLNARFLYLAQAVETLHRSSSPKAEARDEGLRKLAESFRTASPEAYRDFVKKETQRWGEPTFHTRLRSMLECYTEQFGSKTRRKSLISKIVKARNYYTHFDENDESFVADREDLLILLIRLDALFEIWTLRLLGFSAEEITTIAKSHRQMRHRLTYTLQGDANDAASQGTA